MAYTYEQLAEMTVAQLREIAKGIEVEEVKGFSTMHKEKLLPALCKALHVEAHVHHEVVGINKSRVKAEIRKLKAERDAALAKKDSERLRGIRRRIHRLKRTLRRATV
jgi:hypothetical protein